MTFMLSPDGTIYRRKNDGWYRRENSGNWSFFAPLQGRVENNTSAPRATQVSGAAAVYRPVAGVGGNQGRAQIRRDQVPDNGARARAQEVTALERQYYARAFAQLRAQNRNFSRPAQNGGRRR